MSYNISNWKTKELESFAIKFNALYEMDKRGWLERPTLQGGPGDYHITIYVAEGEIEGVLEDEWIVVRKIRITGEGSGRMWGDVIKPALEAGSKGRMRALLVWEGGDEIEMVTVEEGRIRKEKIG